MPNVIHRSLLASDAMDTVQNDPEPWRHRVIEAPGRSDADGTSRPAPPPSTGTPRRRWKGGPSRLPRTPLVGILALGLAACSADGGGLGGSGRSGARPLQGDGSTWGSGQGDGGASRGGGGQERCGNGLDDDGNGQVDEGCTCTIGAEQACWPGDPERRGRGLCRDGVQRCQERDEFPSWGPCEGAVLPTTEIPGNREDEDCDGVADGAPMCTPSEFGEVCAGGMDEDCDGKIDCDDPDCERSPACRDDCATPGACDCAPRETRCGDGIDEDCDGSTDCSDIDCQQCTPGAFRWCDEPARCAWGRQQCQPDGTWGPCTEVSPPSGCEGDSLPFIGEINEYDLDCCLARGLCCQNFGGSGDPNRSVGNCDGIVQCRR